MSSVGATKRNAQPATQMPGCAPCRRLPTRQVVTQTEIPPAHSACSAS